MGPGRRVKIVIEALVRDHMDPVSNDIANGHLENTVEEMVQECFDVITVTVED